MRCTLSFVEMMVFITLYQFAISAPDVGVIDKFVQIAFQSACDHCFATLISCVVYVAMERARSDAYMRFLYVLFDSVLICPGINAASITQTRRYSSFSDIPIG